MSKFKWWIVLGLTILAGLSGYLFLNHKASLPLTDFVPKNAAFVIKCKARSLSQTEIEELSEYNLPPNMLKRLFGNKEKPGPLGNSDMVLFGEQTPTGPAVGILFALEDYSAFSNIVSETHFTGSPINSKKEIQFIEFNTGFYLSWNNEIALLSYQLTSGDAYPLSILNPDREKSDLPEKLKTDSVQCMLKPSPMLQMLNYEKPSQVLSAIAGIIPEKTTLCGRIHTEDHMITLPMFVTEGTKELEALIKDMPGKEDCAVEKPAETEGAQIYLALQKQMVGSISALTGQAGNPLLSKLNGNVCLWIPEKKAGSMAQSWMLLLGTDFSENEKLLLNQLPRELAATSVPGYNITPLENCLLLTPSDQTTKVGGFKTPKNPLELYLRSKQKTISLTGNSRNMQLQLQSQTSQTSPILMVLKSLGDLIPKENTP